MKDAMTEESAFPIARSRFQAALVIAMAADALQLLIIPLFVEGALSPVDDILDFAVGAGLIRLLGWHWEFLPAFVAEMIPGVDLVPFWTIAVANVYRKSKPINIEPEEQDKHRVLEGQYK